MPVTLAQARLAAQDDIEAGVIDEFAQGSYLFDNMTFDDAVSPGTQGSTLTYGYNRLLTPATAAFRAINSEYTPQEATVVRATTDLKVFGGAYQIDRVLVNLNGLYSNIQLQQDQKIKAAKALFNDTVINGDSAVVAASFDGLDKAIAGSSTEMGAATVLDLSTSAAMETNKNEFVDQLDTFLSLLAEKPSALMGNSALINKIKSLARRLGYYSQTENSFGQKVDNYDGIALVDLGNKPGGANPVVPIATRTVATVSTTGLTDLYAVVFGLEAFHGVTLTPAPNGNQQLVKQYLPDLEAPGAVKTGEVEMVAGVALKSTKSAGVLRNIKVR